MFPGPFLRFSSSASAFEASSIIAIAYYFSFSISWGMVILLFLLRNRGFASFLIGNLIGTTYPVAAFVYASLLAFVSLDR